MLSENLEDSKTELSKENVRKIHHYLGHAKPETMKKLFINAKLWDPKVEAILEELGDNCSCRVFENRKPKPAVAIPKANKHNQVVSIDLKDFGEGETKYISKVSIILKNNEKEC